MQKEDFASASAGPSSNVVRLVLSSAPASPTHAYSAFLVAAGVGQVGQEDLCLLDVRCGEDADALDRTVRSKVHAKKSSSLFLPVAVSFFPMVPVAVSFFPVVTRAVSLIPMAVGFFLVVRVAVSFPVVVRPVSICEATWQFLGIVT